MYKVGVALTTLLAGTAFADLVTTRIVPVAAWAESEIDADRAATKAINGAGLNSDNGTHDYAKETGWMSAQNKYGWFVMDLGADCDIAAIKIWNFNWVNSGTHYEGRGVRQFDMFIAPSSLGFDGTRAPDFSSGDWILALEDQVIATADGSNSYAGIDPLSITNSTGEARIVSGRYVALRIDVGGDSSGYCGLAEVRVDVVSDVNAHVAMEGVSSVTSSSATFSGVVTTADASSAEVFLAYGESNRFVLGEGMTVVSCGQQNSGESFSKTIEGLDTDKAYYGAFYTGSGSDTMWSAPKKFITGVISVQMPSAFYESDPGKKTIAFTRPAAVANEPLALKYMISGTAEADYASELSGVVDFAADETIAYASFSPVDDGVTSGTSKTLVVAVLPGQCAIDATSQGEVTVLDESTRSSGTVEWTGRASDVLWTTGGNWNTGAEPNYLDAVVVDSPSSKSAPSVLSSQYTLASLNIGANGTGGVQMTGAGSVLLPNAGAYSIGGAGNGYLEINGICELKAASQKRGDLIAIGRTAGSSGEVVVNGGGLYGFNFAVGDSGTGSLTVNGGSVNVTTTSSDGNGDFSVGKSSGGVGVVTINSGSVGTVRTLRIGVNGTGTVNVNGGTIGANKHTDIGTSAGSSGTLIIDGGSVTGMGSAGGTFGDAGAAFINVEKGTMNQCSFTAGSKSTGSCMIRVGSEGKITGTNASSTFGSSGRCEVQMRGGIWEKTGTGPATITVRAASGGYGLVSGWGEFKIGKNVTLCNNGLFIADGRNDDGISAEQTLSYKSTDGASGFDNTSENESTNGWYAVNKGMLSVQNVVSVAVGDSGTYTWGESSSDDQIDLVNSARITFTNITTKISSLTGKLYAADRSDVPALPSGKEAVGVWKFDITGAYEAATVEFRYDHVKAPRGVQMYQLNADGTTWTRLEPTLLEGYRAKVAVTDASRMFAAVAAKSGMSVIVR